MTTQTHRLAGRKGGVNHEFAAHKVHLSASSASAAFGATSSELSPRVRQKLAIALFPFLAEQVRLFD